jgi:hypothetical protein
MLLFLLPDEVGSNFEKMYLELEFLVVLQNGKE